MKKEKGFTLIELLAVIIIIGILLLLAVPNVYRYLKKGTGEYYNQLENMIVLSGKDYFNDYRPLLPKEINNVTVLPLDELLENKYIDKVVDNEGNKCEARVVAKKTGRNTYEYYTCLMCKDYQTEGEACEYDENNNVTPDTKDYEVKIEDTGEYEIDAEGVYIVDQGEKFDLPNGKGYYKGQLVSDKVRPNPGVIDTNRLGEVKVNYVYQGARAEIIVRVVDRVKPSIPQIVLRKDNKNGKVYIGNWYSGDIYEEYQSTDYSKPGIMGSGIDYYEISRDGSNYQRLDSNYHIDSENGEYNYYVRSVDKSGNIGDSNTYQLQIDKEVPSCSLEVKSGTLGSNNWYTSDVTIGYGKVIETVSGIGNQIINKLSITENTKGTVIIGTVTDLAGNTSSCSITVKVDKTVPGVPKIIASDNKTSGTWHNSDFSLQYSGANNISGNTYYYGTTMNPTMTGNSTEINTNTSGTNYYVKVCSGAGLCSSNSSYEVKLDKVKPNAPKIIASDNKASGTWHNSNFSLSVNGANNISGNTYYYGTTPNPTTILNGTISASTETPSTIYYFKVCSGAGLCSNDSSYQVKLDKTVPTIVAKEANSYVTFGTGVTPSNYFNVTYGISGGSVSCTPSVDQIHLGTNTEVICTVTGGSGLTSSASTLFRHQYVATPYCEGGGTLINNNTACHYNANRNVCGNGACNHYQQIWDDCKTGSNTCQPGFDDGKCNAWGPRPVIGKEWVCDDGSTYPSAGACYMGCATSVSGGGCSEQNKRGDAPCIGHEQIFNPCKTGANTCVGGNVDGPCDGWDAASCDKSDSSYLKYSCPSGGTFNSTLKMCRF